MLALLDACLLWIAFVMAFWIRLLAPEWLRGSSSPIDFSVHFWVVPIAIPLLCLFASGAGLYTSPAAFSYGRLLASVARIFVYLGSILGLAIFLFQAKSFSRAVLALFMGIGFLLIAGERALLKKMALRLGPRPADLRNVLIVGVNPEGREVKRKLQSSPDYGLRVAGYLRGPAEEDGGEEALELGGLGDLKRIVGERVIDEVVFALPLSRLLDCEEQIAWCEEVGVTV